MTTHPPMVVITKIGFDGRGCGSRVAASFLREAGVASVFHPSNPPELALHAEKKA